MKFSLQYIYFCNEITTVYLDSSTVKPVLRGHHWDKEKMAL
jgi:hypothetical protein